MCLHRLCDGTVSLPIRLLLFCCLWAVVCVSANVDRRLLLLESITVMLCRPGPVSHLRNQSDKILTGISGRRRDMFFFSH